MQKRSVVLLLCVGILLVLGGGAFWESADRGGLLLESPALVAQAATAQAQEKGVNFLQQEAGISAYVNVGQEINLSQVRGAFKSVETVRDEYIIGEVALPDLPEFAHPHVYINKDGWIVAYYTKDEPASKMIYWGRPLGTTTISQAIRKLFSSVKDEDVKYYHFRHPQANKLMLIAEGGNDWFTLTIPKGLQIYEASWSLRAAIDIYTAQLLIDNEVIGKTGGILYGDLTSRLRTDFRHTITVSWGGRVDDYLVLVLIYKE
jgi:hypothetical protein